MRINTDKLSAAQLKSILDKRVCVIASEDVALINTARSSIVSALSSFGFVNERFEVDSKFDWNLFNSSVNELSLFSEQKIVTLNVSKIDSKLQENIKKYLLNGNQDIFLLVIIPNIDAKSLKTAWINQVINDGFLVVLYPPSHDKLPSFIAREANARKLQLTEGSIDFIAKHNEGNLLAIEQLLNQLQFLYGDAPIDEAELEALSSENSQFMVFDLSSALLEGDTARIYQIINFLQAEGETPITVNWVLHKEIQKINEMHQKIKQGATIEMALNSIWDRQKPMYRKGLQRVSPKMCAQLLIMVSQIDKAIKGRLNENPWNAIMRTAFAFAGKRVLSLSAEAK